MGRHFAAANEWAPASRPANQPASGMTSRSGGSRKPNGLISGKPQIEPSPAATSILTADGAKQSKPDARPWAR